MAADGKVKKPVLGSDGSMTCNGRRYTVDTPESLSIDRKAEWTIEELRILTGHGEKAVVSSMLEIRKLFNKGEFAQIAAINESNIMRVADIQNRRDPIIWAATLFINRDGEDRTKVPSDNERQAKIDDWNAEGVPYFFLQGCVETFSATLKELCAASSPSSPKPSRPSSKAR